VIARLLEDVASGIQVLSTRDGVALTEPQVWERARNIVAGLVGNYRIVSFEEDEDEDEDADDGPRRIHGTAMAQGSLVTHPDGSGELSGRSGRSAA